MQHVFVQPIEVRFIEYMPFDDNKWAERKLVPYAEMLAERRPSRPTRSAPHRMHKCAAWRMRRLRRGE